MEILSSIFSKMDLWLQHKVADVLELRENNDDKIIEDILYILQEKMKKY